MQMKIQQTPHVRLLVSAALLKSLSLALDSKLRQLRPLLSVSGMQEEAVSSSVARPSHFAETSEGVLYLRTKARRAARM